jgi:hypothetical protein
MTSTSVLLTRREAAEIGRVPLNAIDTRRSGRVKFWIDECLTPALVVGTGKVGALVEASDRGLVAEG